MPVPAIKPKLTIVHSPSTTVPPQPKPFPNFPFNTFRQPMYPHNQGQSPNCLFNRFKQLLFLQKPKHKPTLSIVPVQMTKVLTNPFFQNQARRVQTQYDELSQE